jgi:hypothetical protein
MKQEPASEFADDLHFDPVQLERFFRRMREGEWTFAITRVERHNALYWKCTADRPSEDTRLSAESPRYYDAIGAVVAQFNRLTGYAP